MVGRSLRYARYFNRYNKTGQNLLDTAWTLVELGEDSVAVTVRSRDARLPARE